MEKIKKKLWMESDEQIFITKYFSTLDCQRHEIREMFDEKAYCSWRGNALSGIDEIMKFYEMLPCCKHVLRALDVTPVTKGEKHLLISVEGLVTYFDSKTFHFHESLIVKKEDDEKFIILNEAVFHTDKSND